MQRALLADRRQARLLGMSRGALCHTPRPTRAADPARMRRIDELHPACCRHRWTPHRYGFTTWRRGKVLGEMPLIGAVLKIAMTA